MTNQETPLDIVPEFSHPFNLEKVGYAGPYRLQITATEEECAALAKRCSLSAIKTLNAVFMITRGEKRKEGIKAEGHVHADVISLHEDSLKEKEQSFDFTIKLKLIEGSEDLETGPIDWEAELASDYDSEYYQNSHVDFGELVAQYLSLEVMPFSVSENSLTNDDNDESVREKHPKLNPFEILTKLKK